MTIDIKALRALVSLEGHDDKSADSPRFYCAGCHKMHTRCECRDIAWNAIPALLDAYEQRDAAVGQQAAFIGCLEELSRWPELAKVQYGMRLVDPATMKIEPIAIEAHKVIGIMEGIREHANEMLTWGRSAVAALREVESARSGRDALQVAADAQSAKRAELQREVDDADTQAWEALDCPEGTFDTATVHRLCVAHRATKAKLAALASVNEEILALIDEQFHDAEPKPIEAKWRAALAAAKETP